MDKRLKKAFNLGLGMASLAGEKADKLFKELQRKGNMNKKEAKRFIDSFVRKAKEEQSKLVEKVNLEVQKTYKKLNTTLLADLKRAKKKEVKKKTVKKRGK